MKFFLFFVLNVKMMMSQHTEESDCLISYTIFHKQTRRCYEPFDQGPCPQGEWLVLARSSSGAGVCQKKLTCNFDEQPYLNPDRGAICDCEEGKEKFRGKCATKFAESGCKPGDVLLPKNYQKKNYCPYKFSCAQSTNCPGFSTAKREIGLKTGNKRNEAIDFLKSIVCDKKSKTICCPQNDNDSILSPKTMIRILNTNPGVMCSRNPCPAGKWPWIGEDGVSKCTKSDISVKTCTGVIEDEDGVLVCRRNSLITALSVSLGKQNCGRGRVHKYGRCVRLFRGK